MIKDIFDFINNGIETHRTFNTSRWFENKQIKLFIRYTPRRYINGEFIPTIDIASVSVEPKFQNKKVFTYYLNNIETEYQHISIYVESILNSKFKDWLIKRGYQVVHQGDCVILQRT